MSRKTPVKLSHQQFFKACEALKAGAKDFADRRLSNIETAEALTTLLGFPVAPSSVSELKEAVGVDWSRAKGVSPAGLKTRWTRSNAIRTLARSVMSLHQDLGKEPSRALKALCDVFRQRGDDDSPAQPS